MFLEVERMQYGVGQGCFHTQRISVGKTARALYQAINQFDFVYDCGSVSSNLGDVKPLDWAINHYSPKRSVSAKAKQTVDALFISHFHTDHINGIEELCKKKNVLRVFVPYYTPVDVLGILIDEADSISTWTDGYIFWLLRELQNLTARRDLFNIPTIYVLPDDLDNINVVGESDIPPFSDGVTVDRAVLKTRTMKSTQPLKFVDDRGIKIWEVKAWHYKPGIALPAYWAKAIALLEAILGDVLRSKEPITEAIATTLRAAAATIHKTMSSGAKAGERNHNIVSMCVYSGPVPESHIFGEIDRLNAPSLLAGEMHFEGRISLGKYSNSHFYSRRIDQSNERTKQLGWLGTGDAMLARNDVWNEFESKLEWSNERSELVATILMPHHGSASGENYNPNLVNEHRPLALFSAGAFSKHMHPAVAVVSDVLKHGCEAVNVNEFTRPGVFELVKVQY